MPLIANSYRLEQEREALASRFFVLRQRTESADIAGRRGINIRVFKKRQNRNRFDVFETDESQFYPIILYVSLNIFLWKFVLLENCCTFAEEWMLAETGCVQAESTIPDSSLGLHHLCSRFVGILNGGDALTILCRPIDNRREL